MEKSYGMLLAMHDGVDQLRAERSQTDKRLDWEQMRLLVELMEKVQAQVAREVKLDW